MTKNVTWALLEPDDVNIYRERFTQRGIDLAIKFYQAITGQSISEKEFEADPQLAEAVEKGQQAIESALKREIDAKLKDRTIKHK